MPDCFYSTIFGNLFFLRNINAHDSLTLTDGKLLIHKICFLSKVRREISITKKVCQQEGISVECQLPAFRQSVGMPLCTVRSKLKKFEYVQRVGPGLCTGRWGSYTERDGGRSRAAVQGSSPRTDWQTRLKTSTGRNFIKYYSYVFYCVCKLGLARIPFMFKAQ